METNELGIVTDSDTKLLSKCGRVPFNIEPAKGELIMKTREEEMTEMVLTFRKKCIGAPNTDNPMTYEDAYVQGWEDADEHPKNPWRDIKKELPIIEDEDWQCSCNCLVRVKDSRFYEIAVYFPKNREWCRYDDYEMVVRNVSHWMPIPELKKGE